MEKLTYVSDEFLDEYKTNFEEKYLKFYVENNKSAINELFSIPGTLIESSIEFDFKELVLESEDSEANKKNMRIIWESLRHLSIVEASNEKVWVSLENTYYLDYHLDQIDLITGKNRNTSIKSRTIFTQGNKRSLLINSVASLWWIAYYTYDNHSKNHYYFADRFMEGGYRGNSIAYFSSNLVSNKEIVLGTLEAIYELVDDGLMIENRYSYSGANKLLNLLGGVVILDHLSRNEIKEIVKENLLKVTGIHLSNNKFREPLKTE